MLKKLYKIEELLSFYLRNNIVFKSMYIDYHPPVVERIWFQLGEERVYLHKIHKCDSSLEALFHPHPWESAIRIIDGSYETGVGHSSTDMMPPIDCKLILSPGSCYEMIEKDGWHYVNPVTDYVYSLMITGRRFDRKIPVEPNKEFRELTIEEQRDIMNKFLNYYKE